MFGGSYVGATQMLAAIKSGFMPPWKSEPGYGEFANVHANYRRFINADTEPTLREPGLSIVGLNSAWGTYPPALMAARQVAG